MGGESATKDCSTQIPEAAAVNSSVMSIADTCCEVISTFVLTIDDVEVGGLDFATEDEERWSSALSGASGFTCC